MTLTRAVIEYPMPLLADSKIPFDALMQLDWKRVSPAREEYFVSRVNRPYTYQAKGELRQYEPCESHPMIEVIWGIVQGEVGAKFDMCFLNRYNDGSESIGWHSDDNEINDQTRPIAIVSFGAKRTMEFRHKGTEQTLLPCELHDNSMIIMPEYSQFHYEHRIPKDEAVTTPRISLTFRGCNT